MAGAGERSRLSHHVAEHAVAYVGEPTLLNGNRPGSCQQSAGIARLPEAHERTAQANVRLDNVCTQFEPGGTTGVDSFKQMEASFLMSALRQHNWNRTENAKALGIHKTTLFCKIKARGLKPLQVGWQQGRVFPEGIRGSSATHSREFHVDVRRSTSAPH